MALILVVLAFGVLLDHNPKQEAQLETLRTVAESAPFEYQAGIMEALKGLENASLSLQERECLSLKWSWGARRALTEASSFYGDSFDTVRASGLVSCSPSFAKRTADGFQAGSLFEYVPASDRRLEDDCPSYQFRPSTRVSLWPGRTD